MIKTYQNIWHHLRIKDRFNLKILFIMMVICSLAEILSLSLVLPFIAMLTNLAAIKNQTIIKKLIDFLSIKNDNDTIFIFSMIFILTMVIAMLLRLLLVWYTAKVSYSIGADLGYKIYRKTLYQPYKVHINTNSSSVIDGVINKSNAIIHHAVHPILILLSSILIVVSILLTLIFIDMRATLFLGSFLGFAYFIILSFTKKILVRNGDLISKNNPELIKNLQEGLGGIREVIIDGTQNYFCNVFKETDIKIRKAHGIIFFINASPRYLVETLGILLIISYALIIYFFGSSQSTGSQLPILGAIAIGAQRLLPMLQQAYGALTNIRSGRSSVQEALLFLDKKTDESVRDYQKEIRFFSDITIENLFFKYDQNQDWVLANINLKINKGTKIGFIGRTGSGKSTLSDLVMGLLEPTNGLIKIDGIALCEKNLSSWQNKIAHVPQAIYLSDASIASNIAFGISDDLIDYEKVKYAAQRAQISKTIESWVDGYATKVGERGVRLSGGQRQRIGLARAFYKNAQIIIFDEATSALDEDTEKAVMSSIIESAGNITMIIVAHRLSTLRNCDQVVKLKNGEIEGVGTYAQIIGKTL